MSRFTEFLKEVKIELKKVSWPTRKETTRFTGMVIIVSAVIAIFLGGLDLLFQSILKILV
jgi:preprotein translocase subunit SecE